MAPQAGSALRSVAEGFLLDSQGRVWFTRPNVMKVGVLDPGDNSLTQWDIPGTSMSNYPGSIFLDGQGRLWFGVSGATVDDLTVNEIVSLDPATDEMTEYVCPVGACYPPKGILVDTQGKVWFAEGAYIQKLDPAGGLPVFSRWSVGGSPTTLLPGAGGVIWIEDYSYNYVERFQP